MRRLLLLIACLLAAATLWAADPYTGEAPPADALILNTHKDWLKNYTVAGKRKVATDQYEVWVKAANLGAHKITLTRLDSGAWVSVLPLAAFGQGRDENRIVAKE